MKKRKVLDRYTGFTPSSYAKDKLQESRRRAPLGSAERGAPAKSIFVRTGLTASRGLSHTASDAISKTPQFSRRTLLLASYASRLRPRDAAGQVPHRVASDAPAPLGVRRGRGEAQGEGGAEGGGEGRGRGGEGRGGRHGRSLARPVGRPCVDLLMAPYSCCPRAQLPLGNYLKIC